MKLRVTKTTCIMKRYLRLMGIYDLLCLLVRDTNTSHMGSAKMVTLTEKTKNVFIIVQYQDMIYFNIFFFEDNNFCSQRLLLLIKQPYCTCAEFNANKRKMSKNKRLIICMEFTEIGSCKRGAHTTLRASKIYSVKYASSIRNALKPPCSGIEKHYWNRNFKNTQHVYQIQCECQSLISAIIVNINSGAILSTSEL